uniref:Uncharacterized protein n=1 Tax=Plectus sambesii TaxID=2011161 RepID=A0A914VXZ6_9BILA
MRARSARKRPPPPSTLATRREEDRHAGPTQTRPAFEAAPPATADKDPTICCCRSTIRRARPSSSPRLFDARADLCLASSSSRRSPSLPSAASIFARIETTPPQ